MAACRSAKRNVSPKNPVSAISGWWQGADRGRSPGPDITVKEEISSGYEYIDYLVMLYLMQA